MTAWAPAVVWAAVIFFLSAQSDLSGPAGFPIPDKVAHVGVFGILGASLAWAARRYRSVQAPVPLLLLGALYAASDEWHQSFILDRVPSLGDFVADLLGLVVGFLLMRTFVREKRRV